jgi:hypothetical protein
VLVLVRVGPVAAQFVRGMPRVIEHDVSHDHSAIAASENHISAIHSPIAFTKPYDVQTPGSIGPDTITNR